MLLKKRVNILFFTLFFSLKAFSYDSVTNYQLIKSHQSQMQGNAMYIRSLSGLWTATSTDGTNSPCQNQYAVYILKESDASGYDEVFASVLTAAASGKKALFYGYCDTPSLGLFKATHINIEY